MPVPGAGRTPGRMPAYAKGNGLMKFFAAILILVLLSCIPFASAGEVTLSTPQGVYYVPAGEDASIPLTLASTYDHDVTGILQQSMTRLDAGKTGSRDTVVQSREFSAFTETRTVPLPVGRSEVPADYLLTIVFRYDENGARTATLGGIAIHFVDSTKDTPPGGETLTSTDTPDPVAATSSGGAAPAGKPLDTSPAAELRNSQMAQDTSALRNQMAEESNRSEAEEEALLGIIVADPLFLSRDRSLAGAGFSRNRTGITPGSNQSGSFTFTYSSGPKAAVIRGAVRDTRVLFAEESSDGPLPLPEALAANTTYREYANRTAETGFTPGGTRINATAGRETVDLGYTGARNRQLRLHAEIVNGSVVTFEGESPDDPLAAAAPVIALFSVILISAGIWYLARSRRPDPPVVDPGQLPASRGTPREIASAMLDEAERDAARGHWPEAYRKTGRAIRYVLSHEIGHGEELTTGELERLIGTSGGDSENLREILVRCRTVGFAKDTPDPGEFREMIAYARARVTGSPPGRESPEQ
jgi:hypothetical protein